ncbi:MAG TPA: substrate-binding domain-containing protein [Armatimonadota bacterium]|nr:substrate-binding domain-containing protein [Armatimonadota bacterium]
MRFKQREIGAITVAAGLAAAALLAGCGGSGSSGSGGNTPGGASTGKMASAGAHKKWVIGFSQCTVSEPWRVAMDNALTQEANKHSDEIQVVTKVANDSSAQQRADVEDLMNTGMDLLIISPKEAAPLTGIVKTVYEKHIPVIVLDRGILGDTYTCFIGGDNRLIGEEAGKYAAKLLNGKGNIVEIQGNVGSPPTKDRHDGFVKGLADAHATAKIIATGYGDWKKDKGHDQMRQILAAQPKIDLVYGQNDSMAMGAYLAATEVGRQKDMKFMGIDGLPGPNGGPAEVKEGKLAATFLYPNCGKEAIDYALQILHGKTVPKHVTLRTATITPENAEQYINPK